jgi:predicted deacylase
MINREILIIPGPDGSAIEIPYFEIMGANPGPHLTVIAGIHGAEYSSIAAAKEFVAEINDKEVTGR